MFFRKLQENTGTATVVFDGKHYPVTAASNLDHFNCRMDLMTNVWPRFAADEIEDQMTPAQYKTYKTEVAKKLKDWDKKYEKHRKQHHPELAAIQHEAMEPLTDLWESNFCYFNLRAMVEKGENVPDFRILALEDRYCAHIMEICRIFREFGKLEDSFDMAQMLKVLKTDNWGNIPPLKFYFDPLKEKFDKCINLLLEGRKAGFLRAKYIIEENKDL